METNPYKNLILDVLTIFKYKVQNNECTPEELKNISENVVTNLAVNATIEDIANAFGQSKTNVKAVMSRNQFQKDNPPKTKKFYNIINFSKIILSSWRRNMN